MLATDGKTVLVDMDLVTLLQDVVYLHEAQGVGLDVPSGEVRIQGDRTRLTRAFNNLVQNALESGSQVDVQVRLRAEGSEAVVDVIDNGHGIEHERLERIFEPKFTTKTHGLGLGLAMVRAIVQAANGSISVSSTLGTGTTFTVRLPLHL